ncbi:hypothetical protein [Cellulomonas sp. Y8]|uniref:hypothetical protein n=1 Tax=Cellulomonas sp. Y8 TaxID=2591145 RepID=UPI003D71DFC0
MIAAAFLAAALVTGATAPGPITVAPSHVVIDGLRPGTTGAVDVTVTNTSTEPAEISVTGELTTSGLVDEADLLQVDLAGCAQPWAGVPDRPTAALQAPVCASGEVPASSGSLAAVPLEAGGTLHLLISAGLGEHAGNAAQGQKWSASFDVRALTNAPPVTAPLAITGGDARTALHIAAGLVIAGTGTFQVARRRRARREAR